MHAKDIKGESIDPFNSQPLRPDLSLNLHAIRGIESRESPILSSHSTQDPHGKMSQLNNFLNDFCGPDHEFALIAISPEGKFDCHLSPGITSDSQELLQSDFCQRLALLAKKAQPSRLSQLPAGRRALSIGSEYSYYGSDLRNRDRKRKRTKSLQTNGSIKSGTQTCIRLDDRQGVKEFYKQCLRDFQQAGGKIFGKAWVKLMEPKKQSNHPYCRGNAVGEAPEWWPTTSDPNDHSIACRHREPDHLLKRERIVLFTHILDMIIDPHHYGRTAYPYVMNLNIAQLEKCTWDSLADFFAANEKNKEKQIHMTELFRIARLEERYRRGELDPDTVVFTANSPSGGASASYSDDEEDVYVPHHVGASGLATPDTMISPREGATLFRQDNPSNDSYNTFHQMRENPYKSYPNHSHLPPTPEENTHFPIPSVDSFTNHHQQTEYHPTGLGLHDLGRRPSWQPQQDYSSQHQLPPMQNVWGAHQQITSPVHMSPYTAWPGHQTQPGTLLPPMQSLAEQGLHVVEGMYRSLDQGQQVHD